MKVAKAYNSTGNIYNQIGLLPETLARYEEVLQIMAHNLHPDDLQVTDSKYDLGFALCRL
jgi:hypothetical protein